MNLRTGLLRAFLIVVPLTLAIPALAKESRGTPEEAQALVARAIALYKEIGQPALDTFTTGRDGFRDRDLYIFVIGPERSVVAHGYDWHRLGLKVDGLKDSTGAEYGSRLVDQATEAGAWVDYRFRDPLTGTEEPKSSWVVRHDGFVFGCGVYKP